MLSVGFWAYMTPYDRPFCCLLMPRDGLRSKISIFTPGGPKTQKIVLETAGAFFWAYSTSFDEFSSELARLPSGKPLFLDQNDLKNHRFWRIWSDRPKLQGSINDDVLRLSGPILEVVEVLLINFRSSKDAFGGTKGSR